MFDFIQSKLIAEKQKNSFLVPLSTKLIVSLSPSNVNDDVINAFTYDIDINGTGSGNVYDSDNAGSGSAFDDTMDHRNCRNEDECSTL